MDSLKPDPENARAHDERNLAVIMDSLTRYGQQTPLVVQAGIILKGNATYEAAKRLGWKEIAAIPFDRAAELVRSYKLVDNRSSELASWIPDILKGELDKLAGEGVDLAPLGWVPDELKALDEELAGGEGSSSDGTLLKKISVTMSDPRTKLERHQVVRLGKHILIVCDPVSEAAIWLPHVTPDCLFAPFPGPYAALAELTVKRTIVLVQPDLFIAGHIVDHYKEIHGD